MSGKLHIYTTEKLDRAAHLRVLPEQLQSYRCAPESLVTTVWGHQGLFISETTPAPLFLSGADASEIFKLAEEIIFLGLKGEQPILGAILPQSETPPLLANGVFLDLRDHWSLLDPDDAAIMSYARGLAHWHRQHCFCGSCGNPTRSVEGGHVRQCTGESCGRLHFPRTDPAVIMRVTDGDWCLLARNAGWRPGGYSVLAGFLEIGESLEQTVIREVREEVGITVRNVRYHSSQPWPFPASLMVGFTAEGNRHDPLVLDPKEIESARWFHRDELRASPENDSFNLPRKDSISRVLVEDWLQET
ncbi:NAD(+) diphosphatase [Kiloniella laminariae]|uniref:NAD(+) diphosphatase n=1 Tax=Kiloniella laminariae TaxID=454162 RepID=UPI000371F9A0|nr:NAD(+) diphosphatase [Kiloniella laminariae]